MRGPAVKTALVLVALAAIAGLAGCDKSGAHAAPTTTRPTVQVTTTTRPPRPHPTVTTLPHDPQPSAEGASAVFMQGWIAGNRSQSESVATTSAVETLYAKAYAGQPLNDRGCTVAFPPIVCTWGPYAGGSGSIYEVYVSQTGPLWYVKSVRIES